MNFKSTNFHFLVVQQKVSSSSPGRITWSLFYTMSSAVLEEICSKVTNNPKDCIAGNPFSNYFVFPKFSKKVVAEVFKIPVFSDIWTRIAEFKLQIAIHYNIEPIKKTTKMEFEPTRAETNGLSVHRLNHSAILSIKVVTKLSFCMWTLNRQISIS